MRKFIILTLAVMLTPLLATEAQAARGRVRGAAGTGAPSAVAAPLCEVAMVETAPELPFWRLAGDGVALPEPVRAATAGEARAAVKRLLGLDRLPPGTRLERAG